MRKDSKEMTEQELYWLYSSWTGQLHFFAVRDLGRQLNAEFFPAPAWQMKLSRAMEEEVSPSGIPSLHHIGGETYYLPLPASNPGKEELDRAFRDLCLLAARVLKIKVGRRALEDTPHDQDPAQRDLERNVAGPLRIKDS